MYQEVDNEEVQKFVEDEKKIEEDQLNKSSLANISSENNLLSIKTEIKVEDKEKVKDCEQSTIDCICNETLTDTVKHKPHKPKKLKRIQYKRYNKVNKIRACIPNKHQILRQYYKYKLHETAVFLKLATKGLEVFQKSCLHKLNFNL